MAITFEQLMEAVPQLCEDIAFIKRHILEKSNDSNQEQDELLTIQQTAELLHLTVPTIYGLVSSKKLSPMKQGRRLYFSRIEIIDWLKSGRKKTAAEIASKADTYLVNHKKWGK